MIDEENNVESIVVADITSLHRGKKSFGHFFQVAKMFEDIFNKNEKVVIVGGPVYEEYNGCKELLKYDVDLQELEAISTKLKAKLKEILNGIKVLKRYKNSEIIFQDYSNTSLFLAICLQKSKSDIYIIQYKSEIDFGVNSFLYKIVRKRISGVLCTKKEVGEKYGIPYLVVPDYIYTGSTENDDSKENEEYNYDFGIFGIIRKGKDIVGVAKRFVGIERTLLIAGSIQDADMQKSLEKLAKENPNITLVNRYLSEEEYGYMISATRCMILPYVDEYYNESSSGVVYDALFAKKPVITRRYETFDFVRIYKMGILYDTLNDIDFSEVMQEKDFLIYKRNIERYLTDNQAYGQRLKEFIGRKKKVCIN